MGKGLALDATGLLVRILNARIVLGVVNSREESTLLVQRSTLFLHRLVRSKLAADFNKLHTLAIINYVWQYHQSRL